MKPHSAPPEGPVNYVLGRVDPEGTQAERRRFEQVWFNNLSYYTGAPYYVNDPISGTIKAPKKFNRRRSYHSANLIRPKTKQALEKLFS